MQNAAENSQNSILHFSVSNTFSNPRSITSNIKLREKDENILPQINADVADKDRDLLGITKNSAFISVYPRQK